jgi:hypothetical protein
MTINLAVAGIAIILAICAVAALAAAVEHATRATAWRQIAVERRWNYEHRGTGSDG